MTEKEKELELLRLEEEDLALQEQEAKARLVSQAKSVAAEPPEDRYSIPEVIAEKVGKGASLGFLPAMQTQAELALKPIAEGRQENEGFLSYLGRISQGLASAGPKVAASSLMRAAGIGGLPEVEQVRSQYLKRGEQMEQESPGVSAASELYGMAFSPANLLAGPAASYLGSFARGSGQALIGTAADVLGQGRQANAAELGLSGVLGGVGGLAARGMAGIQSKFQQKRADELARNAAQATKDIDKKINSALGEYRSAVQSGSRGIENLQRLAQSGDVVGGTAAETAAKGLGGKGVVPLAEMIAENTSEQLPSRLSDLAAKKAEYEALKAAREEAIENLISSRLKSPVLTEGKPRLMRYVGRVAMPALGAALGAGAADTFGFDKGGGATVGSLIGAAIGGNPGTSIGNLLAKPNVRQSIFGALGTAAGGVSKAINYAAPRAASPLSEYLIERSDLETAKQDFTSGGNQP